MPTPVTIKAPLEKALVAYFAGALAGDPDFAGAKFYAAAGNAPLEFPALIVAVNSAARERGVCAWQAGVSVSVVTGVDESQAPARHARRLDKLVNLLEFVDDVRAVVNGPEFNLYGYNITGHDRQEVDRHWMDSITLEAFAQ